MIRYYRDGLKSGCDAQLTTKSKKAIGKSRLPTLKKWLNLKSSLCYQKRP